MAHLWWRSVSQDSKHICYLYHPYPDLESIKIFSVKCDGRLCKSGECDEDGQCICKLPDPSTILDGDRPFLGGKHCDEERIMCDGTNSFWCEHGGVCEEIIQGENYTCKCPPGYIGEHCEYSGAPCGSMFCFHRAECIIEDRECACPHNWRGSVDCAFPTKPKHSLNDTTPNFEATHHEGGGNEWFVPLVSVVVGVGVLGSVVSWTKTYHKKREAEATKFQQLSQAQIEACLDTDDEDDNNNLMAPQSH
ncbi:hypothetical protein SUGI_0330160 [Cryptomeria japonica]|nr:hypothetical protein SUGI_0330160 [Cryptomeria japonica]